MTHLLYRLSGIHKEIDKDILIVYNDNHYQLQFLILKTYLNPFLNMRKNRYLLSRI